MKVLVIDDDAETAKLVKDSLSAQAHTVDISADGADGSFLARSYEYDAIVLDYNMPKKDGMTVCREVRKAGKNTPILFLSINDETTTKVAALDAGADDYLVKPFSLDELSARLKALHRRAPEMKSDLITVGNITLNTAAQSVIKDGTEIHLTRKEFNMLAYFMKNVGIIVSRAQIMEHVWTADGNPFSNTVEAHIRNLRKKVCGDDDVVTIKNMPGRGYVLEVQKK